MKTITTSFFFILFFLAFSNESDKDDVKPNSQNITPLDTSKISFGNSSAAYACLEKLDSMCAKLFFKEIWFEEDSNVYNSINMPHSEIPDFSEEEIVEMMDLIPTSIPLVLNQPVLDYINKFSKSRRSFIAKTLGLSEHYFPLYEEVFDKYEMPFEIKYLSVIESGLNVKARSYMGATGLWQFMHRTGLSYGLEVNTYIDERHDPMLATDAAARFLTDLYKIYQDWYLALAAYNAGPGNVNKAIARSGGKRDYWEIRPFLPRETQNYVPQFVACTFVMHYHEKYKILPLSPKMDYFATDTILIKEKVSLEFLAENLGINKDHLAFINPSLKSNIIPKYEKGLVIHLPIEYIGQFVEKEAIILNDTTLHKVEAIIVEQPNYTVYRVKSGDTLGAIANRYRVKISQIKGWNNLKSDFLKIGQKLVLYN